MHNRENADLPHRNPGTPESHDQPENHRWYPWPLVRPEHQMPQGRVRTWKPEEAFGRKRARKDQLQQRYNQRFPRVTSRDCKTLPSGLSSAALTADARLTGSANNQKVFLSN